MTRPPSGVWTNSGTPKRSRMRNRVIAQYGFAESARSAVNQDDNLLLPDAKSLELAGIEDSFNGLEFGEVIATADHAEHLVEFRRFEVVFGEEVADEFVPRLFEVEPQRSPTVELRFTSEQIGFEQRHAATDVAADDVRVNDFFSHKSRADRRASARVQIRETDGEPHAFELCCGAELADRFAFDPRFRRGNQAHFAFCECIHASLRVRQSGVWVGHWSRDCADTSCASDRRAD
jgi:hypothetical protein